MFEALKEWASNHPASGDLWDSIFCSAGVCRGCREFTDACICNDDADSDDDEDKDDGDEETKNKNEDGGNDE